MKTKQKKNSWSNESGFTLIELIMVIAILAMLLIGCLAAVPSFLTPKTLEALPNWLPKNTFVLGLDLQGGLQLRSARAVRGGLGLSPSGAGDAHHRRPANAPAQGRLRHRLEGAVALIGQVPAHECPAPQSQQDRGRPRARTLGVRLGHWPERQTAVS